MIWLWRYRKDAEVERLNKHIAFLQKHCEESHKEILAKIGEVFQRDLEIDQLKKNSAGLLEALEALLPIAMEGNEYIPISGITEIELALKAISRAKGIQP